MPLKPKHEAFINEYFKDFNGTQAAIRAGYAEGSARQQASRLLTNVDILRAIRERLDEHAMTADEVLWHLADIARGDIADVLNAFGNGDMGKAKDAGKSSLIRKVRFRTITTEQSEIHETEVEMYDRLKALEMLSKFHDLTNKVKIESWESEIVDLVKNGTLTVEQVREEIGDELAEDLFKRVGIPFVAGNSTTTSSTERGE